VAAREGNWRKRFLRAGPTFEHARTSTRLSIIILYPLVINGWRERERERYLGNWKDSYRHPPISCQCFGGIIVIPQPERISYWRGSSYTQKFSNSSLSLANCWHDDFFFYNMTTHTFYIDFCYGSEQAAATNRLRLTAKKKKNGKNIASQEMHTGNNWCSFVFVFLSAKWNACARINISWNYDVALLRRSNGMTPQGFLRNNWNLLTAFNFFCTVSRNSHVSSSL